MTGPVASDSLAFYLPFADPERRKRRDNTGGKMTASTSRPPAASMVACCAPKVALARVNGVEETAEPPDAAEPLTTAPLAS